MMKTSDAMAQLAIKRRVYRYEEAGFVIFYRGMSGAERVEYLRKLNSRDEAIATLGDQHLVSLAIVDEDGSPAFNDQNEAFEAAKKIDIPVIRALAAEILKVSGMLADDKTVDPSKASQS